MKGLEKVTLAIMLVACVLSVGAIVENFKIQRRIDKFNKLIDAVETKRNSNDTTIILSDSMVVKYQLTKPIIVKSYGHETKRQIISIEGNN